MQGEFDEIVDALTLEHQADLLAALGEDGMSPAAPSADGIDIAGALAWARARIDQMDARVLLRHVLQCPAARLVAWPEQKLAAEDWAEYRALVERRAAGEPVAYLTGTREFYGREFLVTRRC